LWELSLLRLPPNGLRYYNELAWDVASAYPRGDTAAGALVGCECLGCPAAAMGQISLEEIESPPRYLDTCGC